ncbi:phage repressor protein [Natrononativus amylolyticus]|uniref:phage repressor protein n=1 Tax=Natrononativus amylolyticus TaxID=2963434 RepID=UPI0031F2D967
MALKGGLVLELPAKPLYRNLNRHGHETGYSTVQQRLGEFKQHGLPERVEDEGLLPGEFEREDIPRRGGIG